MGATCSRRSSSSPRGRPELPSYDDGHRRRDAGAPLGARLRPGHLRHPDPSSVGLAAFTAVALSAGQDASAQVSTISSAGFSAAFLAAAVVALSTAGATLVLLVRRS